MTAADIRTLHSQGLSPSEIAWHLSMDEGEVIAVLQGDEAGDVLAYVRASIKQPRGAE